MRALLALSLLLAACSGRQLQPTFAWGDGARIRVLPEDQDPVVLTSARTPEGVRIDLRVPGLADDLGTEAIVSLEADPEGRPLKVGLSSELRLLMVRIAAAETQAEAAGQDTGQEGQMMRMMVGLLEQQLTVALAALWWATVEQWVGARLTTEPRTFLLDGRKAPWLLQQLDLARPGTEGHPDVHIQVSQQVASRAPCTEDEKEARCARLVSVLTLPPEDARILAAWLAEGMAGPVPADGRRLSLELTQTIELLTDPRNLRPYALTLTEHRQVTFASEGDEPSSEVEDHRAVFRFVHER